MSDRPQGLPLLIQPVVVEPHTIPWLADIQDYINTVAYSG
jgi:hypothetical protein